MKLSTAQLRALAKWDRHFGVEPYGSEYRTVASLCALGLMSNAGGRPHVTPQGREILAKMEAA